MTCLECLTVPTNTTKKNRNKILYRVTSFWRHFHFRFPPSQKPTSGSPVLAFFSPRKATFRPSSRSRTLPKPTWRRSPRCCWPTATEGTSFPATTLELADLRPASNWPDRIIRNRQLSALNRSPSKLGGVNTFSFQFRRPVTKFSQMNCSFYG